MFRVWGLGPMSWEHLCWICWPGAVFLQCPGNTYGGYAGQALYSSSVLGTPMLDMLARPCPRYAGQALYSSSVLETPMLDMLARPCIPAVSWEHLCWICWPGLVFLQCPGNTYAGYAGQALYSSKFLGTPLLDMLARLCIHPMPLGFRV